VSKHLSVSQTLELLDRLKLTIRETAATEEKLDQEYRLQRAAALRGFEQSSEDHTTRHAEERQASEASCQAARAQHLARYEYRHNRLEQARQSSNTVCSNESATRRAAANTPPKRA